MVYNFLVFDCTGRLLVLQYVMDIEHIGVFILTILLLDCLYTIGLICKTIKKTLDIIT